MSYFADVKCPKCGKVKQLHLGGYGFFGHDKEYCSYCGFEFNSQVNCMNMEVDRDCYPKDNGNRNENSKNWRLEADSLRIENKKLKTQIEELKKLCGDR